MILSADELMAKCVTELPEEELELSGGGSVIVRALKGSDTSRIFSNNNMDEKIFNTLSKGLVEPRLTPKAMHKFIDFSPDNSIEIFTKIMELSNALGEIEEKEIKEIKKNS